MQNKKVYTFLSAKVKGGEPIMPTCQHCHRKWTYGNSIRKMFRIKKRCPYCSKVNYITAKAQWRMNLSSLFSFTILPLSIFDVPIKWVAVTGVSIILIIIGTSPFIEKFSREREYLT
ncbi:hypothetical protein KK120_15320 [Virgibacillus dakarensis]|nr:hypothetical protein [Virgibacillus dakarensis]